jgi:hypothetical protein
LFEKNAPIWKSLRPLKRTLCEPCLRVLGQQSKSSRDASNHAEKSIMGRFSFLTCVRYRIAFWLSTWRHPERIMPTQRLRLM